MFFQPTVGCVHALPAPFPLKAHGRHCLASAVFLASCEGPDYSPSRGFCLLLQTRSRLSEYEREPVGFIKNANY